MEPTPVTKNKTPTYPTRREVLTGAAALALTGICGRWLVFAATEDGKIMVAPIFEHGKGRGATGCVVMSPPVFLSEEEAMQVVREELEKAGIKLGEGVSLEDAHISRRREVTDESGKRRLEEIEDSIKTEADRKAAASKKPDWMAKYLPGPLKLDGLDAKKKIGVKFITRENYAQSGGPLSGSTAHYYDFKEVAGYVANKAKQSKEPIYLGIFYEPLAEWKRNEIKHDSTKEEWEKSFEKSIKDSKVDARKQLGEQVKDFVAWLKKQNAIEEPKAAE